MTFLEERIGKILEVLKEAIAAEKLAVKNLLIADLPQDKRCAFPSDDCAWRHYEPADWQGRDRYVWLKCDVEVPESMAGLPVYFSLETGSTGWDALNPQFAVYVDGAIRQGFDVNHRDLLLSDKAEPGQRWQVLLSGYSGAGQSDIHVRAHLEARRPEVNALYHDIRVPHEAAQLMQKEDSSYIIIIDALNKAINLLDQRQPGSEAFMDSVSAAREYLKDNLYHISWNARAPKVHCVGHTHIDVAWLWPLRVTEDKAVRSFATVIQFMKEYPYYQFMSSQPQLYKYVEKHEPELFKAITEAIKDKRWEPEGAMFVEADCNISGGEALVRQILHGKRYFREKFGRDNEIVWLPDVFGYSAALPQIFLKSGIKYFMTTKISWNEYNRFPYDTFMWQGLDGSRVLTHFSPSRNYNIQAPARGENRHYTTYNATLGANQVMGAWQRFGQKSLSDMVLMSFGFGDGGGGPTRDMLEAYPRLAKGLPGMPKVQMNDSRGFFHALEKQVKGRPDLPVWVGEMYLEYHRGTYTSMARNKRYNRKSEYALMDSELYSLLASAYMNQDYPKDRINKGWEVLLRNQFHDILPGSSIKEVYEDSLVEYQDLAKENEDIHRHALSTLVEGVDCSTGSLVAFNPSPFAMNGAVSFPLKDNGTLPQVFDGERQLPVQRGKDGKGIVALADIPAKGYKALTLKGSVAHEDQTASIEGLTFQTPFYTLQFNEQMHIASLFDKDAQRELVKPGVLFNRLMSYEDRPHNYDAWDINNYYNEHSWPIDGLTHWEVEENGALRCVILIKRQYLSSLIEQRIILYKHDRRIDFENSWDWKEAHLLVKALFPVDIEATEATYEIQFGHVKRPAHFNTSWDQARFEVSHHKWLDLSEVGYGLSILNDCKFGASVHFGEIGLTLLKSATYPNPDADKEVHRFTYAILPHQGSWQEAGVVQSAYHLNQPTVVGIKENQGGKLPCSLSLVTCDQDHVVVEAVKQAEDNDDIIIRCYEAHGRRGETALKLALPIESAWECDLMEENPVPVSLADAALRFTIKPFEIKTFRIRTKAK